jgi:DNA modification methylase
MTGQVAEGLGRKWISIEINADYVAGSKLRFVEGETSRIAG